MSRCIPTGLTVLGLVQSAGSGVIVSKMAFSPDHQERQWRLEFPYWDTQNNPEQWNANSGVHLQDGKYFNQWQVVGGTWEMLVHEGVSAEAKRWARHSSRPIS